MKLAFKKTLFLLSCMSFITAGSSIAAVQSSDRLQEISGSVLMERNVSGATLDSMKENTPAERKETSVSNEKIAAPVKEKPAPKVLPEKHEKQAVEESVRKTSEVAGGAKAEKTAFMAPVSTSANVETATEQTGVDDLAYEDPASQEKPNIILSLFRVIVSLLVVAGCVVLSGFGLKKFMDKRAGFTFKQPLVNVLSHTYLGPRKTLHVVEVMGKILVLGVSDNSIRLLTEIDPAALEKALKEKKMEPPKPVQPQDASFKGYLSTIMERFK